MSRFVSTFLACSLLAIAAPALGADDPVPTDPRPLTPDPSTPSDAKPSQVPDLLTGAIDPLDEGKERLRFFVASGADAELDEQEFKADEIRKNGFIRPFERWERIAVFDANKNGAIDWFEVEGYRESLRHWIITKYDSDKDLRLSGEERDAAIKLLNVSGAPPLHWETEQQKNVGADSSEDYVTDQSGRRFYAREVPGSGPINDILGFKAKNAQLFQLEVLERFDANDNGTLQPEEQTRYEMSLRERLLDVFDADHDGNLDAKETARVRSFTMRRLNEQLMQGLRKKHDADGDGVLTASEKDAVQRDWDKEMADREEAKQMLIRRFDADEDGTLSKDEAVTFTRSERERRTRRQMQRDLRLFDTNRDGRIDESEEVDKRETIASRWKGAQAR